MPERLKSTGKQNPLRVGREVFGAGDEFTTDSIAAKTLIAIGYATRVDDWVPGPTVYSAPGPVVETRDLTAEAPNEHERKKRGRAAKGAYLRRDMNAEE